MKKIVLLFTLILVSSIAMGQSVSKQINNVKRSSDYLSAEATMETESTAYEVAEELLAKQVAEYARENNKLMDAPNVIVKDVAGKAEKIKMNRGTMVRVFLYVKKSDVLAANNTRVIVQKEAEKTTVGEQSKEENQLQQDAEEQLTNIVRSDNPGAEAEIHEAVEDTRDFSAEATENTEEKESVIIKTEEIDNTTYSENTETEQRQSVEEETAQETEVAGASIPEWKQNVINSLLRSKTASEAQRLLNRYSVEKRVKRYGNPQDCRNPGESYWLIFDNQGKIITVLGEGNTDRVNYKTLMSDELKNYTGMGAIWFTMSN